MNTLKPALSKLKESVEKIETIKKKIQEAILALPENDAITPLGNGKVRCFAIKASELLRGSWSPKYHCFQTQYEAIASLVERAQPENVVGLLFDVIARKSIKLNGELIQIHPKVAAHLRSLI